MAVGEVKDEATERSYKIIIIGAGIAGISAAHHLAKNGETDFKILEARNRIGGRIVSVPLGDTVVDLGASWIHGIIGNPLYELAAANGLVDITNEQCPHLIVATTEDGKRVPISIIREVYSAYFSFYKRCEEYFSLQIPPPAHTGNSVGKHLELDIGAYLQQYRGWDREIRRMVFNHLLSRETCSTACHSMHETGLADFGSYSELPGGNIPVPRGYYSIVDCLAQSLPKDCIWLQMPVENIGWKARVKDADDSFISANTEPVMKYGKVSVKCADGTTLYTNHVIVTIPLGVLKLKASKLFEPPLPDYKLECFEKLSFGVANKIFLEYDRPFSNTEFSEIITLWKKTEECDMDKIWFRKIFSFRRLSENVLFTWISGLKAEYLETLTNEQVGDTCTVILRKFLNDPDVPKPCKVICTSWKSEPYTRGAYTSIGVKGSQRDIELLSTPIYSDPYQVKPVLLFAGEATHSTFYSAAHGAYLSGKKTAELLLEPDGDTPQPVENTLQSNNSDLSSRLRRIDLT